MPEQNDNSFLVDLPHRLSRFEPCSLELQIAAVRELMTQNIGISYLLMPYYKKLLNIASSGDKEPHERPFVEEL